MYGLRLDNKNEAPKKCENYGVAEQILISTYFLRQQS